MPVPPPTSEAELLTRARKLAGATLGQLASRVGRQVPRDLRRDKGWVGTTLELSLGALAGSKPVPDFEHLGIELKTIPVAATGRPRESTFVCVVPVDRLHELDWEYSHVRRKLQRVLWVPVLAEPDVPLGERRIGSPLLWSCDADPEAAALRADWEELTDQIRLGFIDSIGAEQGEVLQIRPKAANSRAERLTVGESGWALPTLPRGFYLRAGFTGRILARHYAMPVANDADQT